MTAAAQNHRVITESLDKYAAVLAWLMLESWSHKPAKVCVHYAAGLANGKNRDGRKHAFELSGWS
jgi:hypothetical protein